jgi:1-acyl-sn-glycerol-3-phosphate acyltransferase
MTYFWRSTIFNLAFYSTTAVSCIVFLPFLLFPRSAFMWVVGVFVNTVYFLEKNILGLDYEIRGLEHLPKDKPFIVAAKHQSPYETFKLRLLFDDPAIILKRELTKIPLWGWYLAKSDVIAIDRGSPEAAMKSMESGGLRMRDAGRPIVIFPQGTRVRPQETPKEKPYKPGVFRIQAATGMSVVPMALNSGAYWPRSGWIKRPGKVVFEFMKPIPAGKFPKKEFMKELERRVEEKTEKLMKEAENPPPVPESPEPFEDQPGKFPLFKVLFVLTAFLLYSGWWFFAADQARAAYLDYMRDLASEPRSFSVPLITGYPGPINLSVPEEYLQSSDGTVWVRDLSVSAWPIPLLPVKVRASSVQADSFKWPQPLVFSDIEASLIVLGEKVSIRDSKLRRDDFEGGATGTIDFAQKPYPALDLNVTLRNHSSLMLWLAQSGILKERSALFISAGLTALQDPDGAVRVPLTQKNQTLYAGPLPVASLPEPQPSGLIEVRDNQPALPQ